MSAAPTIGNPGGAIGSGRYRVLDSLGRGGMGEVHRVEDVTTGKLVALKRCRADRATEAELVRFRREFHTLASFDHPRIVEVFDYGVDAEGPFYTMELLDGRDLRELAPLEPKRACALLRDTGAALGFLHSRRLLHRDLGPRNVRSTTDGRAKLIDFGVMGTIGVAGEVVGTPPCIAPEMLLGMPLDHRADLFALGALAYWLLTGRHAFPAKHPSDLLELHLTSPPPVSSLCDAPQALDELIASLLSAEPRARPASAAEVCERLGAIGGLPPAPELESALPYVQSAVLVGRDRELRIARDRLAELGRGEGSSLVVRGRSGMGKSRLLREVALEAKLAGAAVCEARGDDSGRGAYGVVHTLVEELLRAAPELTRATAAAHAEAVTLALPELAGPLGLPRLSTGLVQLDPREQRLRVQNELADFFGEIAAKKSIALLVDDVQRADEASAALLASLAQTARQGALLLLVGLRSDESPRAPTPVGVLREHSFVVRARHLEPDEVFDLVRQTFADVPNARKLASWLAEASSGRPLECVELVRDLVERRLVRYLDGVWVIADDLGEASLPKGLRAAMDTRIERLDGVARAVGQTIAIYGRPLSVELSVTLSSLEENAVFGAIDKLVTEDMLVGSAEGYRFRHDGFREAFVRNVGDEERVKIHLRIGETLLGRGPLEGREAEVGWHILRGGDPVRGAKLLERAGRSLFDATSFGDAIAPLEAAVRVYDESGREKAAALDLRYLLLMAGFYADKQVADRWSDSAIEGYAQVTGMAIAHRWKARLGVTLAVLVGVVFAVVRGLLSPSWRWAPGPVLGLDRYLRSLGYAAGVAAFSFDTERLVRYAEQSRALRILRRADILAGGAFMDMLCDFNLGHFIKTLEGGETVLGLLDQTQLLSAEEKKLIAGGARYQMAMVAMAFDPAKFREQIDAMLALDLRIWEASARQLEAIHHMWRGESEEALRIWSTVELESVRLGSMWQVEATFHPSFSTSHGFLGDILGLKRAADALERLVERGFRFERHLCYVRAEYHRMRGEAAESIAAAKEGVALGPPGDGNIRLMILCAQADAHFLAGSLAEARHTAEIAEREASAQDSYHPPTRYRAARTIAKIDAVEGNATAALARLEANAEASLVHDLPCVTGALHEVAAQIAHGAGERERYEKAVAAMKREFERTKNPVLIARAERVSRLGETHAEPGAAPAANDEVMTQIVGDAGGEAAVPAIAAYQRPEERAALALELLLASSHAPNGFLFLRTPRGVMLAAPLAGDEPTDELRRAAAAVIEAMDEATRSPEEAPLIGFFLQGLDAPGQRGRVGVVAFRSETPCAAAPEVVQAVARALEDAGDAQTHTESATVRTALPLTDREREMFLLGRKKKPGD